MSITTDQCRSGRALVGWDVRRSASQSGLGVNAVSRFENGSDTMTSTVEKLRGTLQAASIEFPPRNGGKSVRKRK